MAKRKKAKRTARPIISGYLERVSAQIFDKYQKEITDMIRGHQGLYALYRRNKLYYVGLATNLKNRIRHHLSDKHQGKWTHFSLYIIRKTDHTKELESLLLRIADPTGNAQKGKLRTKNNLLPKLKVQVKRKIKEEYEILFKGQRQTTKTKRSSKVMKKTERPLYGFFPKGKVLYATYKGKQFKAWLCTNARIRFDGHYYDTPSAAGKVARKKSTNGWNFWKYKDKTGKLVKLTELRK